MATTRIWKVGSNLSRVVDYAKDETKAENPAWSKTDYQTMRDVMDYAMDDAKTEKQFYVTALNCNADYAREQMQMTKRRYDKTDGILAWHGYQSFAEGEVDADTAHKIGVALAKELWPDFEVIVATHLNTHCFHNHFVLNSVSFLHGRKFNACRESYKKMRAASDRLCREYGLSVITEHQAYYPKHYAEWQAEQNGQRTWRSAIREDVDRAVLVSMTWSAFLRALREQGYEVKTGVKHIAVRPPGKERFVRLRSLGETYTEEAIRQRILRQYTPQRKSQQESEKVLCVKVRGDFRLSKITWKGLRALYFFYLRKLRAAQHQPSERVPYLIREDLRLLDQISEQNKFLIRHKVDTPEQLAALKESAEHSIKKLSSKRKELMNEKRRTDTSPMRKAEIMAQMSSISAELKTMRRDVRMCADIAEWAKTITRKYEQLKEQSLYYKKCANRQTEEKEYPVLK